MNQSILAKLEQLSMRLEEINALLSDQSIASDQNNVVGKDTKKHTKIGN